MLGVADARQSQDVRRADGACRQDHLARRIDSFHRAAGTAARELDTGRALAVKHDAVHQCVSDELQVWPL